MQQGLDHRGATSHKGVVNNVSGRAQVLYKESWKLGFETSTVGNFVKRAGMALA
jgi:hypothetical protein|tara:strand:- start:1588 stop:1749 length:162 start_codon:yes stop_codon:yes gene_type:complete